MNVNVPHAGPGTHTLLVAIEIADNALADPTLDRQVLDRVAEIIRPVLAKRRSGPVADAFLTARGLTLDDMRARDRSRDLSEARQELMLLLHRHDWPLTWIGELLHRDHTTVLYGIRAAEARERHDDTTCEDCGAEALGGGRWCLRCFQHQRTDTRRTA